MKIFPQQAAPNSVYQWIGRFFVYSAGPFLITYLLLLLSMSYISQQDLKQASSDALSFNLEKRVSVLSYFHSERLNDIKTLANDRTISDYFSNRALGMSMEYGLRASLLLMERKFKNLVKNKKINSAPIYLRLMFLEAQSKYLVNEGLFKNIDEPWLTPDLITSPDIKTIIFQDKEHSHLIILYPYHYKGKKIGTILAEINYNEVIQHLIHPENPEHVQYTLLTNKSGMILSKKK